MFCLNRKVRKRCLRSLSKERQWPHEISSSREPYPALENSHENNEERKEQAPYPLIRVNNAAIVPPLQETRSGAECTHPVLYDSSSDSCSDSEEDAARQPAQAPIQDVSNNDNQGRSKTIAHDDRMQDKTEASQAIGDAQKGIDTDSQEEVLLADYKA